MAAVGALKVDSVKTVFAFENKVPEKDVASVLQKQGSPLPEMEKEQVPPVPDMPNTQTAVVESDDEREKKSVSCLLKSGLFRESPPTRSVLQKDSEQQPELGF